MKDKYLNSNVLEIGSDVSNRRKSANDGRTAILIVEDEIDLSGLLATAFQSAGFRVHAVSDGDAAKQLCSETPIDIVLSDIHIPGIGGVDLFNGLKEVSANMPLFFFMTGFPDYHSGDAFVDGASGYFSKPFDINSIVNAVSSAYGKRYHNKFTVGSGGICMEIDKRVPRGLPTKSIVKPG